MNKKYVWCLLPLLISLFLLSGCQKSPLSLGHINSLTLQSLTPEFQSVPTATLTNNSSSTSIEMLVSLINLASETSPLEGVTFIPDFSITAQLNTNKEKIVLIDLDFANDQAIIKIEDTCYAFTAAAFHQFLELLDFETYYSDCFEPTFTFKLSQSGAMLTPSFQGTWKYETYKDHWVDQPLPTNEQAEVIKITNPEDQIVITRLGETAETDPSSQTNQNNKTVDTFLLTIKDASSNVLTTSSIETDILPLPTLEGAYTYQLDYQYTQSSKPYQGALSYRFKVLYDYPTTISIPEADYCPGDIVPIYVKYMNGSPTLSLQVPFIEAPLSFYATSASAIETESSFNVVISQPQEYVCMIPIDYRTTPGDYSLTFSAISTDEQVDKLLSLTIAPKEFEEQHLTVSSATNAIRSQENIASDAAFTSAAKASPTPTKLWDGPFLQPVEGRISTEYGSMRFVNDATVPTRHSGIDIANKEGTPIMASNTGKIVLAQTLYITGNTIIIDHGLGLFTTYCHLSEMSVKVGDDVTKSQLIGKIGTTGFSTGPHLHFTVQIGSTNMNPWTVFARDPLPQE